MWTNAWSLLEEFGNWVLWMLHVWRETVRGEQKEWHHADADSEQSWLLREMNSDLLAGLD